ncbi:hypothetical protein [Acidovorax soli]|uniref:Helix-turn-helix domain-containing protein n=1 Tax=Acidovorax soli TaxID=592050 RepID=A0A1H3VGF4_9BURK|nr:hypothetical protein [Acidovorax soli]SDZ73810.1 hypothetical protein SAMN05421875_101126 [Acidovorax soli]
MANGRNKLRRGDAGRDAGGFVALPWVVLDSPAYAQLSMHARALLLEVARQFTRDNNGWLLLSRGYMAGRGWNSVDMLTKAKRELLDAGFIFETVKGQRPNKAARYAVTWRALDRHPGYDIGATEAFQRGAYRMHNAVKIDPPVPPHGTEKNASLVPPHGPIERPIAPSHGTERAPTVPPHGTIRAHFGASPVPPHGHLSREPSKVSAAKDVQGVAGVQKVRANIGRADSRQKREAAPRPTSPMRRLRQQVRDEAVRGMVRTESTAQLELMLR